MSYYDYLGMTKQEDSQETFKNYLVEIKNYEETIAIRESFFYYKEVK